MMKQMGQRSPTGSRKKQAGHFKHDQGVELGANKRQLQQASRAGLGV